MTGELGDNVPNHRSAFEQGRAFVDVEVLAAAIQSARPLTGGPAEWADKIADEYARLMSERGGPL